MLAIRCTKKLLKVLNLPEGQLVSESTTSASPLGNGHAHLIRISRKSGVIFVNDATLYSCIFFGIAKSRMKQLPFIFKEVLQETLLLEGLQSESVKKLLEEFAEFQFGKSMSRSVLGSINDSKLHYEYAMLRDGGVGNCYLPKIIHDMNRIPQKNIGWRYSIEVLSELLLHGEVC